MRASFAADTCPKVDYEALAPAFTYSYFLLNYWKAARVFTQEHLLVGRVVFDLGCGSGATALAYLTALESEMEGDRWHLELHLIDRSARQLELAANLIEHVTSEFKNIRIQCHQQVRDLQGADLPRGEANAVLVGHVLNENPDRVMPLVRGACDALAPLGQLFVIERTGDRVWDSIDVALARTVLPVARGVARLGDIEANYSPFPDVPRKVNPETEYAVVSAPANPHVAVAVERYFTAWRQKSIGLLGHTFEKDALYHEKPFVAPLRGLDAIVRYWETQVIPQTDLHVNVTRVAYSDRTAFCEWVAEFRHLAEHVYLAGALVIEIDAFSGKIRTFREYFRSKKDRVV